MHIHHLLLRLGHSHRRAVLIMYLWTGLVAFSGAALVVFRSRQVVVAFTVGAVIAIGLTLGPLRGRRVAPDGACRPPSSPRPGEVSAGGASPPPGGLAPAQAVARPDKPPSEGLRGPSRASPTARPAGRRSAVGRVHEVGACVGREKSVGQPAGIGPSVGATAAGCEAAAGQPVGIGRGAGAAGEAPGIRPVAWRPVVPGPAGPRPDGTEAAASSPSPAAAVPAAPVVQRRSVFHGDGR
jgi:hypothetical protein